MKTANRQRIIGSLCRLGEWRRTPAYSGSANNDLHERVWLFIGLNTNPTVKPLLPILILIVPLLTSAKPSIPQFLHIRTCLSRPPLPTFSPSGLQSTAYTSSRWPGKSSLSFPVLTSHALSVVSLLALTNNLESAEKQHWYTGET